MNKPSGTPSTSATPRIGSSGRADQLQLLWDQGQQPDVGAFLAKAGTLPLNELAAVLRVDQRQRWQRGQQVPAEAYLQRFPTLRSNAEAALDLIYNEFLLREKLGIAPGLDQFVARFPDHAVTLKQQIELHLALDSSQSSTLLRADGPPSTLRAEGQSVPGSATPTFHPSGPGGSMPRELGRYRIVRLLGRGGMGEVYHAHDTTLDRPVALKVLPFSGTEADPFLQRFHREAQAAAKFTHPHLCPVYDVGTIGGIHFLTMPYIQGQSLAALIRQGGPLPLVTAVRWAGQIAHAVQAAHAAGVLHRDLKPSNVMINERHEPVVIDFGLALRQLPESARLTPSGGVMGTPAYLAPELAAEQRAEPAPAADVYALGVILYEMLTGQVPFQGSVYETLRKIIEQEPVPPSQLRPGLSPELEAICLRAMHKRPADRHPSMAALAADLERIASEPGAKPVVAAGVSAPSTRPRPAVMLRSQSSTQRTWLALAGGAMVLTVLAVVVVIMNSGDPVDTQQTQTDTTGQVQKDTKAITPKGPTAAPIAPADLLQTGSRWKGDFAFREPITNYTGDVMVIITERIGNTFKGEYSTETGKWQWKIQGTVDKDAVNWDFTEIIKEAEPRTVVGTAKVRATLLGSEMKGEFYIPNTKTVADMTLKLRKN